jgi:hypothetical protein
MKASWKRIFAQFLIRVLGVSALIRRLQPIATDVSFGKSFRPKIDGIRNLLRVTQPPSGGYARFGDNLDGGYVLFNEIKSGTNCISIGAGTNISFDTAISRFVEEVHLYDHTIQTLPQVAPENVKFFQKGLGITTVGDYLSLEDCVAKFPIESNLILKMDIEGAEWDVLDTDDLLDLSRFDQIAIEFHNFYKVSNEAFFCKVIRVLTKLNASHQVINLHANNWGKFEIVANVPFADVLEVTYISRLRFNEVNTQNTYSIPNKPCNPFGPEIELAF